MIKYISRFSGISFLFFTIISLILVVFVHHQVAEKIIKHEAILENKTLVDIYKANVWYRNLDIVKNISQKDPSLWHSDPTIIQLAAETFEFLESHAFIKIDIYDHLGRKLLSTNKVDIKTNTYNDKSSTLFGNDSFNNIFDQFDNVLFKENKIDLLNKTIQGEPSSDLILSALYKDDSFFIKKGSLLITYLPMYTEDKFFANNVSGIMEITQDISVIWEELAQIRNYLIIILITIIGCAYLITILNIKEAEKIISLNRHEQERLINEKNAAKYENDKKSEFLINVARELKSSFEMILKFSEHLKHETFGKLSDERYKECAEDIYFVGDHVLEMVDDIFDYARSDVSRLNLNFALVDARKILNNSIKLISNKSLELAIDIAKNYDNEPLLINVDAKRLKQSIIYILNNSLKFTPTGGTIKVEAHKILNDSNEELVEIVIEDSGTGISDYDLLKYLSPQKDIAFSQQDKYGGTGLGIPFTKNIVESMNGEFILTSQLGIGTKVVVRFYFCDS